MVWMCNRGHILKVTGLSPLNYKTLAEKAWTVTYYKLYVALTPHLWTPVICVVAFTTEIMTQLLCFRSVIKREQAGLKGAQCQDVMVEKILGRFWTKTSKTGLKVVRETTWMGSQVNRCLMTNTRDMKVLYTQQWNKPLAVSSELILTA